MAAFDYTIQHSSKLNNILQEAGSGVTIAGVSGQDFTIATKLRRIKSGLCTMETDGMPAIITVGPVTDGQVTFTRLGAITTSADTVSYTLLGW